MNCPKCNAVLKEETTCCSCAACGGVWFRQGEAAAYFGIEVDSDLLSAIELNDEIESRFRRQIHEAFCPDCGRLLTHVETEGLLIEQCEGCKGTFFDEGESIRLHAMLVSGVCGPTFRKLIGTVLQLQPVEVSERNAIG